MSVIISILALFYSGLQEAGQVASPENQIQYLILYSYVSQPNHLIVHI